MNFSIESYVAITPSTNTESNIRHKKATWEATVSGSKIYPIGVPLPFIISGRGCFGYATVKEFTVNADVTTVRFEVSYISDKEIANTLYNLYRNGVTAKRSGDYEDDEDVVIPGLGIRSSQNGNYGGKKRPSPNSGWNANDDRKPLSSYFDD